MADAKALLCGICGEHPKKYKCPTCRVGYCGAPCFKAHKDGCRKPDDAPSTAAATPAATSYEDDGSNAVHVPEERLRRLAEDAELRTALRDPRLQRVLADIDAAGPGAERVSRLELYRNKEGKQFMDLLDRMLLVLGYAERTAEGVVFNG